MTLTRLGSYINVLPDVTSYIQLATLPVVCLNSPVGLLKDSVQKQFLSETSAMDVKWYRCLTLSLKLFLVVLLFHLANVRAESELAHAMHRMTNRTSRSPYNSPFLFTSITCQLTNPDKNPGLNPRPKILSVGQVNQVATLDGDCAVVNKDDAFSVVWRLLQQEHRTSKKERSQHLPSRRSRSIDSGHSERVTHCTQQSYRKQVGSTSP